MGSEGVYIATIEVATPEVVAPEVVAPEERDYYSFDLAAGDIIGADVIGRAGGLELYHPDGTLMIGSSQNINFYYPAASPLPRDGNASLSYVIHTVERYALSVLPGRLAWDCRTAVSPIMADHGGGPWNIFGSIFRFVTKSS